MRFDRWKILWSLAMLAAFGGASYLILAGDGASIAAEHEEASPKEQAKEHESHGAPEKKDADKKDEHAAPDAERREADLARFVPPGGCLADAATLEDLRRRKAELEEGRKELVAKEAELKAREQALSDEMKKLADARDEVEKADGTQKKVQEEKVAKLVEMLETMSPKPASQMLATLDDGLAVSAMARLSTPKLAKMMNVMDVARSTKLSELMAGVVRARQSSRPASSDAAAATQVRSNLPKQNASPTKGGENYDGKSQSTNANSSSDDVPAKGAAGAEQQRSPASVRKGSGG